MTIWQPKTETTGSARALDEHSLPVTEVSMTSALPVHNAFETVALPTTIIEAPRLAKRLGGDVFLASEAFQYTGSFKFRAAYHVACHVQQNLLLTASSGNFGQALAHACSLKRKSCIVVMPATSAEVKVQAVREYGGTVELIDTTIISRAERLKQLFSLHPEAYVASPYDDPLVIAGNSTLGHEISNLKRRPDIVIAPVGGGGLISGIAKGLSDTGSTIEIFGAEPVLGNDAVRSLRTGQIVANSTEPLTIADGARTISLGKHNWEIIRKRVRDIVEISEESIRQSVKLLFSLANVKAEPTGALSVAALLEHPDLFQGRSVCCIVSGGNVDPFTYSEILSPYAEFERMRQKYNA